jgi:hypothetical protein
MGDKNPKKVPKKKQTTDKSTAKTSTSAVSGSSKKK